MMLIENQCSMLSTSMAKEIARKREALAGFLSPRDYAKAVGVHVHTVLNWIRYGKIPAVSKPCGKYTRYLIPENVKPPMRRRGK